VWISVHQDITDRKRAEEFLKQSEGRYRTIIENMEDGYHEVDINGNFTFFNESMRKIMGYEREELLGMNNCQYADEENTRKVYQTYNRVYRTGEPVKNFEWQIIRKDGDRRDIEVSISLIRDTEGHPTGFRGIVRDATERRRIQEDLRQAEERYRSIFENAQEGIYRSTPGGRIILANQTMAKIFGYASPEELMSGITDVARQLYVDPEERAKIQKMIEKHGFVRNYETQLYRKDGSIIWISMTMHAVRDEKGQVLYYEGMDEDITDRKENVERMRKALGATVQAIAMIVETRDPYTAGHQRRVADLARSIATEMKLPVDQIDGIRMAAAIHDLGKISVPAEILSKPTKLTALEFSLIKTHAQSGRDILKDIDFPWPIARMVLEHHERIDGSGYPQGLIAEETLLESRILAVADVLEAIASHRPYRPAWGIEAALEEIEKNRGMLYDTSAVDACLRVFREKGYQLEGT
jgi:PAS domain S-box-containing protein